MGSILRSTDGVTKFEMPKEGVVVITFDDRKTTTAKIVQALGKGRFTVMGKPVYVKPDAPSQQGASPGAKSQSRQGGPGISDQPQELPLYITSPDSSGTMSR
ncbi:MAG: hypothetical protein WCJ37_04610 [Syntrophus sp. (in: bacteria)]